MKKIFSKYFVVAVVAVAMGCISSCKDFEDEMYSELRGQDVALKKDLNEQIGKLRQEMKDSLQKARDEREALQSALDAHIADAEAKYATKDELAAEKTALEQQIAAGDATLQTKLNATNARIDSLNRDLAVTITNVEVTINELADVAGRLEVMERDYADVEYVDTELGKLNSAFKNYYTDEQVDSIINNIEWETVIKPSFRDSIVYDVSDSLKGIIAEVQATANDAVNKATQNAAEIATIKEQLCKIDCAALLKDLTDLQAKVDSIEEVCATLESDVEEAKALAEEAKEFAKEYTDLAIDKILAYTEPRFNSIEEMLAELFTQTEEQEDWLIEHEAEINELLADVEDLKKRVEANEKAIESLAENMEDVTEAMKQRISSVLLQGAYSPVIGYFNMPFGVKSNVLAAYIGKPLVDPTQEGVNFPFAYSDMLMPGNESLANLKDALGANDTVFHDGDVLSDGKAGKAYLTLNPIGVDTTGVKFEIVNSEGQTAPVKIALATSTDKLMFGYTRANVPLYEAVATITDMEATKLDLKRAKYEEIFRDLKNGDINPSEIINTLYATFNEMADANAISATWTDSLGETYTVLSEYNLATVSVEPLSFNTARDLEPMKSFPMIDRVRRAIDNAIAEIQLNISFGNFDPIKVDLKKLELNENSFEISISKDIEIKGNDYVIFEKDENTGLGVEVEGEFYPIVTDKDVVVSVKDTTINFSYKNTDIAAEILKIENTVNGQIDELQDVIEKVNAMLAQLSETENSINQSIQSAKDQISSKLNGYLDRLNNRLCGMFNSINDKLQPVLLLKTTDEFALLSQSAKRPVKIANGATLVPTTYTAELLAPAYKKFVAITAIDGSTDGLKEANAKCENFNKVIDGDIREGFVFYGDSGKTYEITYSALDYHGFMVNTKYYVTVK